MVENVLGVLGLGRDERFVPPSLLGESRHDACVTRVENPATGQVIAGVRLQSAQECEQAIVRAHEAFVRWREVPAPARGQVVRAIGEELRVLKEPLARLVSLETGKIYAEGLGEVQEAIDIAEYAVGLSRQLPGQVFPSERAGHRLFEQWLPLGPIGVITAFNFPCAVWAWNAMLAGVCGDSVLWKPSLRAPLTAIATNAIARRVASGHGHEGVFETIIGTDQDVASRVVADRRLPLISATGSCAMGRLVGKAVADRLGRCLLELGGNNAAIVHSDADLNLAAQAIVFAAVGTAGQRCTTTRRLIAHKSIVDALLDKLVAAFRGIIEGERIGDPMGPATLVGPLISAGAVEEYVQAIEAAKAQGGRVLVGGKRASVQDPALSGGHFVEPTIIRAPSGGTGSAGGVGGVGGLAIARRETFAPILYVFSYQTLDEAIELNNSVEQGLSSAIFTESLRVSERFLSPTGSGSDCGIANVNAGTSGAEIGGAFGGEKDTGGGRESGSDSWKTYMRRQTCVVNAGGKFELAQGIRFE